MRLFIFWIGIMLLPACLSAQSTELKYSRIFEPKGLMSNTNYHEDSERIVAHEIKRFHSIDVNSLNIVHENLECMKDVGFPFANIPMFTLNLEEKIYYIFIGRKGANKKERKQKPYSVIAQEIDPTNGKCIGDAKLLLDIKEGFTCDTRVFIETNKQQNSIDKLIFTVRKKPEKKDDALNNEIVDIHLLDHKFNLLKQGTFKMPYTEQKMDNGSFFTDKENNLYMLAKVRESGKANDYKEKGKGNQKENGWRRIDVLQKHTVLRR